MKTIFGVCSTTPSNKKLKNGYTMYDWIKRQKCFPKFWGRNISGPNAITELEMNFLKENDCKVLFIFDGLEEKDVSAFDGTDDASIVLSAMRKLNVPRNKDIAIFVKLNPGWSINHNWMISFARAISSNGFVPGFIGNTDSSKNFNFDRQCSHFVQATKDVNYFGALFMATEPKLDTMPEEWTPYCPSALEPEDMHLWSCGTTTFDFTGVEDVYAKGEKVLENMW